jgi:hypothetical protein
MASESVKVQIDSVREMGRLLAADPMRDLEHMNQTIAQVRLSSGANGAFGVLGAALGGACDEVKENAQRYLQEKRRHLAGLHEKAMDTANTYVDGNNSATIVAANMRARA